MNRRSFFAAPFALLPVAALTSACGKPKAQTFTPYIGIGTTWVAAYNGEVFVATKDDCRQVWNITSSHGKSAVFSQTYVVESGSIQAAWENFDGPR